MRRDVADDALDRAVARVDDDALRLGDGGIDAAEFAHVNEPLVIDEIDGHGNLVRVRRQHQARRTAFVQRRDAVAVGIGEGFVGELPDVIEPDALAAHFVAGRTGCIDERFQKVE